MPTASAIHALFRPYEVKNLRLANRIVMAPMTRSKSPGGVPGPDVAAYYRRRAEGGVGLIVTEGTYIPHPAAGFDPNVPRFYGDDALAGWRRVVEEVHAAGGRIAPQLWHVGASYGPGAEPQGLVKPVSPSGLRGPGQPVGVALKASDIDEIIAAYGKAARSAKEIGFDAVEIHGAHGYLPDQFFWEGTNQRTDEWGGDLVGRTRFAAAVIREVRRNIGPELPLIFRYSQWKIADYDAKLARTPEELERLLRPLVDAGVDVFHCSTRRFWEPEFEGSHLNLAGWTKKLTGTPAITVGSVTLNVEFFTSFRTDEAAGVTGLDDLLERLERDEFDLVAIGRALIANPDWPMRIREGAVERLTPFHRGLLAQLT
jgi:2,4-dienoyl-CoA reductase-like NADH-dependent reductase (Old Yellow Enzyme family)